MLGIPLDAAYAAFEDHQKGSLTPGKLADLVVLSQDILTIAAGEVLKTHVVRWFISARNNVQWGSAY